MGNFISVSTINRFIAYCTLGSFILTTIAPLQALPVAKELNLNLKDINFGIRVEKLIEKARKYFSGKDSHKLTEVMWDIKSEIESYTGQKININHQLDRIEKEAKSRGFPVKKAHMKEMRKRFKSQEKRFQHKAKYLNYMF